MNGDGELPMVRRTGKSDAAFRTISEVAEELDVPQHVLRFWESKFPQVKPLKRGGGRRYYRPEDVALLRRIRDLLYSEGYTIKGVQKLLREGAPKDTAVAPRSVMEPAIMEPVMEEDEPLSEDVDSEAIEFPEINDGEEGDDEAELEALVAELVPEPVEPPEPAPVPVGPPLRFSAETRQELQALLAELEQLKEILHRA